MFFQEIAFNAQSLTITEFYLQIRPRANVDSEGRSIASQGGPKHPQSFARECHLVGQKRNHVPTNQTTKLMILMFDMFFVGLSRFTRGVRK